MATKAIPADAAQMAEDARCYRHLSSARPTGRRPAMAAIEIMTAIRPTAGAIRAGRADERHAFNLPSTQGEPGMKMSKRMSLTAMSALSAALAVSITLAAPDAVRALPAAGSSPVQDTPYAYCWVTHSSRAGPQRTLYVSRVWDMDRDEDPIRFGAAFGNYVHSRYPGGLAVEPVTCLKYFGWREAAQSADALALQRAHLGFEFVPTGWCPSGRTTIICPDQD